jgi:transcriptional regulator GlxA family with amidase domain
VKQRPRCVWFVVFPGSELLDLSGPWSVLGYANEVAGHQLYTPELIAPTRGDVRTRHGVLLGAARSLEKAWQLGVPDTLVIAGGAPTNGLSATEAKVARWLRDNHRSISRIVSVCTGAFVLGEAGLLDRRHATTHWQYRGELRRRFPKARVDRDDIFLRDGRIWTSAGITAGIDLMLALVEEDHGHELAMTVAKNLVLFLRRSGQQAQFSQILEHQEREPARTRGLTSLILEHLDKDLPVEWMARRVGMSTRTFSRWCEREFGRTPATLVRRLRLEEARRLLVQTSLPLKVIAARTGVGDLSTLWRVFTRHLGVTPAEYRARFTAKAERGTKSKPAQSGAPSRGAERRRDFPRRRRRSAPGRQDSAAGRRMIFHQL